MTQALVIGATGLVGGHITQQLLEHPEISGVQVFVRRPTGLAHPKLTEHQINYDDLEGWRHLLQGDVLFSALGTTRKRAGSKEAQYKVDYTYQHDIALAAAQQGVSRLVLISSAGADAGSMMFYPRIKGELEEAAKAMPFEAVSILQPSVLEGDRDHERPGEELGVKLGHLAARLLPPARKWRPIPGATVARAAIQAALTHDAGRHSYSLEQVFTLAQR